MKKIFFTIGLTLLVCSFVSAQITGGGYENPEDAPKTKKAKGVFKNYWNFNFLWSSPVGTFAEVPSTTLDAVDGKVGMSSGIGFDIGQTFYLKNVDLGKIGLNNKFKLGVEASYLNFLYMGATPPDGILSGYGQFLSCKVGPTLSFNPVGKWLLSAKFIFEPSLYFFDHESKNYSGNYEYSFHGSAFLLRNSIGFYARHRPFIFGIDLSFGGATTEGELYRENISSEYGVYTTFENTHVSTTRFDFIIGFSF